ncbi:hypothetical protein H4219_006355, partial [Mycoemilia scoparia]
SGFEGLDMYSMASIPLPLYYGPGLEEDAMTILAACAGVYNSGDGTNGQHILPIQCDHGTLIEYNIQESNDSSSTPCSSPENYISRAV